jgi:MFS family permease
MDTYSVLLLFAMRLVSPLGAGIAVAIAVVIVAVICLLVYRPPKRTVLSTVIGVLVGPFVGYLVAWWLYSMIGPHTSEMWWFGAFALALFIGAPLGLVTFGVIGFLVGRLLDNRATGQLLDEQTGHIGRGE